MFEWFAPATRYKVVEVEKPRKALPLDAEMRESLRALQFNPAFVYLLDKLRLQRNLLETQLRTQRMESIREVEFVQSGVFWSQWVENQLRLAVQEAPRPKLEPVEAEIAAFNEIDAALERVGVAATSGT